MTLTPTRPSDAVLDAMVDRVEGELLAPKRRSEQRRRRVRRAVALGAAVLLVGAGLSVTAAFALPKAPTVPDVTVRGASGNVIPLALTVQCLNGSGAGTFSFGSGRPVAGETAARANPASLCPQPSTASAVASAVAAAAAPRIAKGATCGTDVINDTDRQIIWRSTRDATGKASITQTATAGLPAAGCPLAMLRVPAGPSVPVAVCAIDGNDAAVFARGNLSAVEFCNALGEEVWKG